MSWWLLIVFVCPTLPPIALRRRSDCLHLQGHWVVKLPSSQRFYDFHLSLFFRHPVRESASDDYIPAYIARRARV
ncbi:hypothetical protein EDD17DRAFT_1600986, partial [Pisolithus thermaeus]